MKKLLFAALILALFNSVSASADVVSLDKATAAARQYFNDGEVTRAGAIEPVLAWTYNEVTKGPYAPAFYVFNNPQGGWMIISGEDACHAILAHSDTGSFDPQTLPENFALWLDSYADQIEWVRMKCIKQSAQAAEEWNDLLTGNIRKAENDNIECFTPKWNQRLPYNYYCPRISNGTISYTNGTRTVTGCVATATAEVMRYHMWPEHGYGELPDYSYEKSKVKYDIQGHTLTTTYDWSNMSDTYPKTAPSPNTSADNVAALMYDLAVMVQAEFGTSGTSASTYRIGAGLVTYMYYDPGVQYCLRNNYSESEWREMLIEDLTYGRPVIYGGKNDGGTHAHQFVVDGYKPSDATFHVNWGWGGYNNGWFALSSFVSYEEETDSYIEYNYKYSQDALFNLKPLDKTDIVDPVKDYRLYVYYTQKRLGFSASYNLIDVKNASLDKSNLLVGDIPLNTDFYVYSAAINWGLVTTGYIYLAYIIANYKSNAKTMLTNSAFQHAQYSPTAYLGSDGQKVKLSSNPKLGDKIMLGWATSNYTSISKYTPIVGTYKTNKCNDNIPLYDVPFISVKDGGVYSVGEYFDFEIVNSRTAPSDMSVTWIFDNESITPDEIYGKASRLLTSEDAGKTHTIKAVVTIDGVTQTLIQEITVQP